MILFTEKSFVYICDFLNNNSLCKCNTFRQLSTWTHTLLVWEQNNRAGYKMTQLTEYEMTVGKKWSVIYSIAILKSWWLHRIFLHLHHSYDSLFSTRVESYSLLGRCVSDVLGCLWLLSNLGGLCCSNFCCNFFLQSFSCFPGCLKLIHFRKKWVNRIQDIKGSLK